MSLIVAFVASLLLQLFLFQLPMCYSDVSNDQCGKNFGNRCLCGKTVQDGFLVNCTNTGFTNTSVLEHLPSETEVNITCILYSPNKSNF